MKILIAFLLLFSMHLGRSLTQQRSMQEYLPISEEQNSDMIPLNIGSSPVQQTLPQNGVVENSEGAQIAEDEIIEKIRILKDQLRKMRRLRGHQSDVDGEEGDLKPKNNKKGKRKRKRKRRRNKRRRKRKKANDESNQEGQEGNGRKRKNKRRFRDPNAPSSSNSGQNRPRSRRRRLRRKGPGSSSSNFEESSDYQNNDVPDDQVYDSDVNDDN